MKASAKAREAALGSRYFWASASAVSRSDAMPVAKREAHRRPGNQPDPLAEAEDRIEHDARRAGQRAAVERGRAVGVAAAADESRAIGLPFDGPLRPAFEAQDVHRPHGWLARIPRAPMAEQRRAVGQVFRFEKQLAERRMREIVGRRRQDDLRVAGDVDFADPRALVDHRHADGLRRRLQSDTAMSSCVEISSSWRRNVARSARNSTT